MKPIGIFEKELLEYLGYGLDIASDTLIINDESYFYDDNFGFRKSSNENSIENTISGNSLKMFLENLLTDENEIKVLRKIIKTIFTKQYPDIEINGDKLF